MSTRASSPSGLRRVREIDAAEHVVGTSSLSRSTTGCGRHPGPSGALDRLRRARRADDRVPDDRVHVLPPPALSAERRYVHAQTCRRPRDDGDAEAFLLPRPTIAQRLVCAERTIRDRGLPSAVQTRSGVDTFTVPEWCTSSVRCPMVPWKMVAGGVRRRSG